MLSTDRAPDTEPRGPSHPAAGHGAASQRHVFPGDFGKGTTHPLTTIDSARDGRSPKALLSLPKGELGGCLLAGDHCRPGKEYRSMPTVPEQGRVQGHSRRDAGVLIVLLGLLPQYLWSVY